MYVDLDPTQTICFQVGKEYNPFHLWFREPGRDVEFELRDDRKRVKRTEQDFLPDGCQRKPAPPRDVTIDEATAEVRRLLRSGMAVRVSVRYGPIAYKELRVNGGPSLPLHEGDFIPMPDIDELYVPMEFHVGEAEDMVEEDD